MQTRHITTLALPWPGWTYVSHSESKLGVYHKDSVECCCAVLCSAVLGAVTALRSCHQLPGGREHFLAPACALLGLGLRVLLLRHVLQSAQRTSQSVTQYSVLSACVYVCIHVCMSTPPYLLLCALDLKCAPCACSSLKCLAQGVQ